MYLVSAAAIDVAAYSASIEESVTHDCFLICHKRGTPFKKIEHPDQHHQVSTQEAQDASEKD